MHRKIVLANHFDISKRVANPLWIDGQARARASGTERRTCATAFNGPTPRGIRDPPPALKPSAPGKIRTCDFRLRRAALYPLSYGRVKRESLATSLPWKSRSSPTHIYLAGPD